MFRFDANGQVAFARRFGEVTTAHPTVPSFPEHPAVLDLNYGKTVTRANNWHTDVTFVDRPPLGSILRSLVIPPVGGFCSPRAELIDRTLENELRASGQTKCWIKIFGKASEKKQLTMAKKYHANKFLCPCHH